MKNDNKSLELQRLISMGMPMKDKPTTPIEQDKQLSQEVPQKEELQKVDEPSKEEEPRVVVERAKRKTVLKGDYETLFICKNDLKERKTIYVAKEIQAKLAEIVMSMRKQDVTIGIYVENIILHHFETYKDEINTLGEIKSKRLL